MGAKYRLGRGWGNKNGLGMNGRESIVWEEDGVIKESIEIL